VICDFRFINQYSDVDPIIGNKRGYRWNTVAPEIGVKYWRLLLKGNFQFLGSYNILNKTDEDIKKRIEYMINSFLVRYS